MDVIPAIDILDGRCVRLFQGDYDRETVYSNNPMDMAKRWAKMGAARIHVVDLDAARSGTSKNLKLIQQIVDSIDIPIQMGGGIRGFSAVRAAIDAGVERVIIGTAAVESPDILGLICSKWGPDRVAVSIDVRNGYVATRGWTHTSELSLMDVSENVIATGVHRIVYTDITRDGTLTEPNFGVIQDLVELDGIKLLVAGGIASMLHLAKLSQIGVESAIVGTAAYTDDINMAHALKKFEIR